MPYKDILKRIEHSKNYYNDNKEYWINYNKLHKEEKKEYDINYRKLNNKNINKYHKKYFKNRRKIDIEFKLGQYMRNRIYCALKRNVKSYTTKKLIGCRVNYLKNYLEAKFKEGMSWSNYGKWEIDHIKPCSKFDLSKKEQQRKCFNYKNLQPLWMKENRTKYNKVGEKK